MTTSFGSATVAAGDVALASQYNALRTDMRNLMYFNHGRLTLAEGTTSVSGEPVTTTDIAAATTIYFTPYFGSNITTYRTSGARNPYNFTQMSLALNSTDHPANTNFDMYLYDDSVAPDEYGDLSLISVAWTTDLTRADDLLLDDGIHIRDGYNPIYKFLGSFRTVAAGQTEDSVTKRFLANYYNAVPKNMHVSEATENTSTTDTPALWNGSVTNNQLGFIVCQPYGIPVDCSMQAWLKVATANQYARSVMYRDGAATSAPRIEISNYNESYVQCNSAHPQHFATGYHYINSYVDGTDGGTATFDTLVLSAKVWV